MRSHGFFWILALAHTRACTFEGMTLRKLFLYSLLGAAALGFTSCETTETKRRPAAPPPAAQAPTVTATAPPPPPPEKPAPKVEPVEALIAQVEKEYKAGQENYAAGHLEAAKQNFDRAVNLLLEGPVPVRSDRRLQQEFEKVVEGVHGL